LPNSVKPKILFLYGNDPNPSLIERAHLLEETGRFESHIAFWHRQNSDISIPFSTDLPDSRTHQINLPDPRGNAITRGLLSLRFARKLRSAINRNKINVVYAVNPDMLGLANIALFGNRRVGITYDFQDQKGDFLGFIRKYIFKTILRKTSFVLIRSEGFRNQIVRHDLVDSHTPVKYMAEAPLGWQTPRPSPENDHLKVGYYGNIRGRTQLKNLISAVGELRESGKNIKLDVAGGGPDSSWFQNETAHLDFVNFSGAFDYFKNYKSTFEAADIIHAVYPLDWINYYTHEARRFHEAIAAGIPLIVSSGTYMSDRVETLNVGWTVRSESKDDLIDALSEAHDNRDLLTQKTVDDRTRAHHQLEHYEQLLIESIEAALK